MHYALLVITSVLIVWLFGQSVLLVQLVRIELQISLITSAHVQMDSTMLEFKYVLPAIQHVQLVSLRGRIVSVALWTQ